MEGSSKGMASRKGCAEGAAKVFQKREGSWKLPGNKQLQDEGALWPRKVSRRVSWKQHWRHKSSNRLDPPVE